MPEEEVKAEDWYDPTRLEPDKIIQFQVVGSMVICLTEKGRFYTRLVKEIPDG